MGRLNIWLLAGIVFHLIPVYGENNLDDFMITSEGPSYTVTTSFTTGCPPESLLMAFMKPEHIVSCMKRANLHIEVLDTAEFHNRIIYIYSYVISKLRLQFDRSLDTAGKRVNFTLEKSSTSGSSVVPRVVSSHGYYSVVVQGGRCLVDYRQKTTIDRDLNDFYLFFIRRDTRRVLRNQERYVNGGWRHGGAVVVP